MVIRPDPLVGLHVRPPLEPPDQDLQLRRGPVAVDALGPLGDDLADMLAVFPDVGSSSRVTM